MKTMVLGLVGFVAMVGAAWAFGQWNWARKTDDLSRRLEAARQAAPARVFDPGELEGLPEPVVRHLRQALPPGTPIIRSVDVTHHGTFNMGESEEKWKPFTSRQRVVTQRPGFVWDARVSMGPGLTAYVHDAYVDGEGVLEAAIDGAFTVVDLRDRQETARGEFMRFFAEAPWYPTALLPSQGVKWEAIDERSARGTLADGDTVLSMTFTFGPDGLIETIRADSRGRTVGSQVIPTPWEGRMSNYQRRDGLLIPTQAEVAWLTPQGRWPYYRGAVREISFRTQ